MVPMPAATAAVTARRMPSGDSKDATGSHVACVDGSAAYAGVAIGAAASTASNTDIAARGTRGASRAIEHEYIGENRTVP